MTISKVELEASGIKRALKKFDTENAIAQYIWNGFDAKATRVYIEFIKNEFDEISSICIKDNGTGINYNELMYKFKKIFTSNKAVEKRLNKFNPEIHGENGIGRFTFFLFSTQAVWTTVFEENGSRYKYKISIKSDNLDEYDSSDLEETTEELGTYVEFYNFSDKKFTIESYCNYLMLEFAWYLELKRKSGFELHIDGIKLDYSPILLSRQEQVYNFDNEYNVTYCIWNRKLHEEYSKYYYIDSQKRGKFKENTTMNNKGDRFYHSVYIQSDFFDEFNFNIDIDSSQVSLLVGKESEEFNALINMVNLQLRNMRNPFIKKSTSAYIDDLKKKKVYPIYNKLNAFDKFREESLDEMIKSIYASEPKIFTGLNLPQQKILVRLLDMSLQSGEIDSLYKILEGVLDMNGSERDELANLLEFTEMSYITKTITLIKDRMQAISDLKELVLNKDLNANERDHLQKMIEKHYWIFGEEYYLVTAEEPDFEEALRRYLYVLHGESEPKGTVKINDINKNKEMDIFAVQRKLNGSIKKSIVVELKHPNITVGTKELQQVKNYFNVISKEQRFNSNGIEWVFYLIGNKLHGDLDGEFINASSHGERSLVYKVGNKRIYIKTWSDIFTDQEINYNFLQEKLIIKQNKLIEMSRSKSRSEILSDVCLNTAIRPAEVTV